LSDWKVMVMLAQFAQALPNATVNIIGGGITAIPSKVPVLFIAGTIQAGWGVIGSNHTFRIELQDEHGTHVTNDQGEPILVEGEFSMAPAPGIPFGTPLSLPLLVPITPPELTPGTRYEFKLAIDGQASEDWNLGFVVMPEAQSKAA
jgi:hypothetical protein